MAYVEESRRSVVSRVVLGYLRVTPGPVFVIWGDGIFSVNAVDEMI